MGIGDSLYAKCAQARDPRARTPIFKMGRLRGSEISTNDPAGSPTPSPAAWKSHSPAPSPPLAGAPPPNPGPPAPESAGGWSCPDAPIITVTSHRAHTLRWDQSPSAGAASRGTRVARRVLMTTQDGWTDGRTRGWGLGNPAGDAKGAGRAHGGGAPGLVHVPSPGRPAHLPGPRTCAPGQRPPPGLGPGRNPGSFPGAHARCGVTFPGRPSAPVSPAVMESLRGDEAAEDMAPAFSTERPWGWGAGGAGETQRLKAGDLVTSPPVHMGKSPAWLCVKTGPLGRKLNKRGCAWLVGLRGER